MNGYKAGTFAREAETFSSNQETLKKIQNQIRKTADHFVFLYRDCLTDSEKCHAKQLIWGLSSVAEYNRLFLVLVLMNSYKVFDESHERYIALLQVVNKLNPEWIKSITKDHEAKIARCKVSVYPIGEALTA